MREGTLRVPRGSKQIREGPHGPPKTGVNSNLASFLSSFTGSKVFPSSFTGSKVCANSSPASFNLSIVEAEQGLSPIQSSKPHQQLHLWIICQEIFSRNLLEFEEQDLSPIQSSKPHQQLHQQQPPPWIICQKSLLKIC